MIYLKIVEGLPAEGERHGPDDHRPHCVQHVPGMHQRSNKKWSISKRYLSSFPVLVEKSIFCHILCHTISGKVLISFFYNTKPNGFYWGHQCLCTLTPANSMQVSNMQSDDRNGR